MRIKVENGTLVLSSKISSDFADVLEPYFNENSITGIKIEYSGPTETNTFKKLMQTVYDKQLKTVAIINTSLYNDNIECIANVIRENPYLTSVTLVHLKFNEHKTQIVESFKNSCKIEKITLDDVGLKNKHFSTLLGYIHNVTTLSVRANFLNDKSADQLAIFLSQDISLQKLYLDKNSISCNGCINIMTALKQNTTLKVLSISNNKIGRSGLFAIADVLAENKTLEYLYIDNNKLTSDSTINIFDKLCTNSSLKEISISVNTVDEIIGLAKMLELNTTLTGLRLINCIFSGEMINIFSDAISTNNSLKHLTMYNCEVMHDGIKIFSECLSKNSSISDLYLCIDFASCDDIQLIINAISINTSITKLYLMSLSSNSIQCKFIQTELAKSLKTNYTITDITENFLCPLTPEVKQIIARNRAIQAESRFRKQKCLINYDV